MSSCSLVNVIQTFPWNISRHIYIAPNQIQGVRVSGVSFDWEFLLTSAFVDAKVIIKEWLLLRRIYPHKNDVDFSDLNLIPSTTEFRRKVLARACLFEDYEFYELISKAYLYMVALYEEEQDYLAVFTELQYAIDMLDNNNTSTHTSPSLLANPDWAILARWLKRAVLMDLQSSPALLSAAALCSVQDGAETFSIDAARRLLHEHFLLNAPSELKGGQSQLFDNVATVDCIQPGRLSLFSPTELDHCHSEVNRNRQDLPTDPGAASGMKRARVEAEGCEPLTASDSSRQQLQTQIATEATMQQHFHQQQQQQQLMYQHQSASTALAAYRDHPNQQATGLRSSMPLSATMPSSHSGVEQTTSPMVQGLGIMHIAPQQQQHLHAPSIHMPTGTLCGSMADATAAAAQHNAPYPPQAVLGPGGLAGYYAGRNSTFPYYSPSPIPPTAASTHALHLHGVSDLPTNSSSSSSTSASYVQMGKGRAAPVETVGSSWNWPPHQHSSALMQGHSDPISMATQGPPPPLPLPLLLQPGSGTAELWIQAGNTGWNSTSGSAGMGPPAFPRSQSGAVLSHSSSAASLRPILSAGILGMGAASRPQASNSSGIGSVSASPQPPLSMSISNPFAVNRRQKKNRDKFRVTFQFSMARGAELQRQYGLTMDTLPPPVETADSHNSNASKVSTGDVHYSLLVALKGIDVLPNGRYRVQLNTFMNGKKKFSRNSTDLYEALWIFEIALLISDSPSLLSELQRIGNYNCLAPLGHLGLFATPREYYLELGRHILLFYDTVDFFNEDLITLAIRNYNAIKPAVTPTPPSFLQQPAALYSAPQTHRVHIKTETVAVGLSSTVSNEDSEDEGLCPSMDVSAPVVTAPTVFLGCPNLHTSRAEAVAPISWMDGFSAGLSLQEQQLSGLFCLRSLCAPSWMPRMSMVKEDKPPAPLPPQQMVHTIAAATITAGATVNTTTVQP